MGSLNDERLSKGTFPAITPDDLDGEQILGVTIANIEIVDFGNGDVGAVAEYEEMEGKKHRLNATSRKRLEEGFGTDDTGKMIGKRVALEIVKAPNPKKGGQIGKSVWIAEATEWPGYKAPKKARRS